jgi:hypothetical protein
VSLSSVIISIGQGCNHSQQSPGPGRTTYIEEGIQTLEREGCVGVLLQWTFCRRDTQLFQCTGQSRDRSVCQQLESRAKELLYRDADARHTNPWKSCDLRGTDSVDLGCRVREPRLPPGRPDARRPRYYETSDCTGILVHPGSDKRSDTHGRLNQY